jgi:Phospholipid methyltransferase
MNEAKFDALEQYRTSELFTDAERAALDYVTELTKRYKENTFTSATIEAACDQKVISTGPYAIVRHPMYAGGLLYLLGMPLALGSYWGAARARSHDSLVNMATL